MWLNLLTVFKHEIDQHELRSTKYGAHSEIGGAVKATSRLAQMCAYKAIDIIDALSDAAF